MSFYRESIVILLVFLIAFLHIRMFLLGLKTYQLNNSAYRKRKKGETFKEWLFYSRYKEEIPKILRVYYYTLLIIHPVCLIGCLCAYIISFIISLPFDFGREVTLFLIVFDFVTIIVIQVLFWAPRRDIAYERWITKKRGQKPKKK